MCQKKINIFYNERGFTLIEVLLSVVILSFVMGGMFMFFTNAMTYTSYNQSKTVAVNIARGVVHYMARLDFQPIASYVNDHVTQQTPFIRLDASSCSNTSIFPDETVCKAVFSPTVNNVTYDKEDVQAWIIPYDQTIWSQIKNNPPSEFPDPLKQTIQNEKEIKENVSGYLLRLYVTVRSNNELIVLKGVIANESIR
ncbi:prepilin-type N-terminal cleavage/methylation domain-containing protein [Anoxybacillus flavithermus]|uniref:prepilin-type N-terminal cleavage/methylation domain-containing protein n=1 Tax=Anoxybacillus flavithermus TaxID=33934 RepID=UPI00186961D6|nr:prepilin-type N-terminal cleavage/methylation domain-containing protein [Anoxybacillus flavithermus]MBE2939176.1 prepilin-type N-terminal cleavage/methylation domain-containing protein [Anoxybacillus flavithermus]MBE2941853.1 prepilin-type N-terminal cleavage/methylation domain-containing protein [Anoxybacillus flavithermus]MBE2950090.1 prepilin-type N-terminal cleavage/methylation domain-containing protein [Anoxybacillus flavithermus]MBE2952700.1 prepilin-type N-terminal cleavage/methylatio